MAPISSVVPRWEWRAFGDRFEDIEARILARPHERKISRETYILCDASDANVKIRHDQLDVKLLQHTDRGLELWSPVLKASFPLRADVIAPVFASWGIAPPATRRARYTRDQFLDEIIPPVPQLRTVDVAKDRRGVTIDGCMVEVATLTIADQTIKTVAVEMDDPDQVLRTVEALGLAGYQNENYVHALKRILACASGKAMASAQGGRMS